MKICIIKLGADGDVLRTLPLSEAIKKKYKDAEITWITKGSISTLLEGNPVIDVVKTLPYSENEQFDALYNFDVEEEASSLAVKIKAEKKYGFYSENGFPIAFNSGAEYYLNTMFDDELKKNNAKTYQEMMFMAAEIPYEKRRYELVLNKEEKEYTQRFIDEDMLQDKKIIGIHMGAGSRWPSKAWHKDRIKEFIKLANEKNYAIILFGGPNEIKEHVFFAEELKKEGINVYRNNPENSKREFASLVSICNCLVCSDSFARKPRGRCRQIRQPASHTWRRHPLRNAPRRF